MTDAKELPSCLHGETCTETVTCTPETCEYRQRSWRHTAEHIKHHCAHDFGSGPWVVSRDGLTGTTSCRCGLTAMSHDMRYGP